MERRRILLVEDDVSIVEVLTMLLEEDGYSVASALDAESALAAARAERFGLVLLDLLLPGKSGDELLAALEPHLGATPVLVLSAARDAAERSRDPRVAGYLAKPFDVETLLQQMERLYLA